LGGASFLAEIEVLKRGLSAIETFFRQLTAI
jgi:hypothetical protein